MARKQSVGLIACPFCDFADAEVREDKNGKAYSYCPECDMQSFTRTAAQDARMRERMRPIAAPTPTPAPEPTPAPAPIAEPAPEPSPQPAPARQRVSTLLG